MSVRMSLPRTHTWQTRQTGGRGEVIGLDYGTWVLLVFILFVSATTGSSGSDGVGKWTAVRSRQWWFGACRRLLRGGCGRRSPEPAPY